MSDLRLIDIPEPWALTELTGSDYPEELVVCSAPACREYGYESDRPFERCGRCAGLFCSKHLHASSRMAGAEVVCVEHYGS